MSTVEKDASSSREHAKKGDATNRSFENPGVTSPMNSSRRTSVKMSNNSTGNSSKRPVSAAMSGKKRQLENELSTKKKRYLALKKELIEKHKMAQSLYDDMNQLREKVISCGANDPGKIEEVGFIEITKTSGSRSSREKKATSPDRRALPSPKGIDENIEPSITCDEFIASLEQDLKEISKKYEELCRETLEKHNDLTSLITEIQKFQKTDEDSKDESESLQSRDLSSIIQSDKYEEDKEILQNRLNEIKCAENHFLNDFSKKIREKVECYLCRAREGEPDHAELSSQLNSVIEELRVEREKNSRRTQTESLLQKARQKIRDLENRAIAEDTKMQQLQTSLRTVEAQYKQKEQAIEGRLKDMQKVLKNSEDLVAKAEKQRDTFEARLTDLKEKMNAKEEEAINTINEKTEALEILSVKLNEEREKRQLAEEELDELRERFRQLEEKSQQLCELAEKAKTFTVADGNHTHNEVCLFNDLQAAREEVEVQRAKVAQLQREKDEIISVMHQAANEEKEDEDEIKNKLATELIAKSNELQSLMMDYTQLQKTMKIMQEKHMATEKQLSEIQNRLHVQAKEGGKASWSSHVIELQQEVSDLRNTLAEATRRNNELETTLTQKQLELEQRDRVMREQSKFLKVRDELLGLMRGKDRCDNGEISNDDAPYDDIDEVNKQIAEKTEAFRELYASLENKQMQVLHLEKMIKQMEDQQDRAQAQRTRLENRIAQLELALQEKNKNHRSRGFGIL